MSRLLKIRPSSQYSASASNRGSQRRFDADSGQIYTEMTCRAGPMTADWMWKTKGITKSVRRFRFVGPGCASLENMAIRSVIANSSSLTAETLQDIPWHIAQKIWQRVKVLELDSHYVWKAFAAAYPGETDKELRHRCHLIEEPDMSLEAYVKPILSPLYHWIVYLTISNVTCSRTELVGVSRLVNLGAVTIGKSVAGSCFDDSIIRAWGRAAAEVGAFSMLRVLVLVAQKEVTPRSFIYLNQFPSLALFNMEDCSLGTQSKVEALALGWRYRTCKDLTDFLIHGGLTNASWDSTIQACFRQAGALGADHLSREGVEAIDSLPVLHFCLGLPPKEAGLEITTNQRMRCFQRLTQKNRQNQTMVAKRPFIGDQQSYKRPAKKPIIRTSKQKDFSDLLMDFGS